MRYLSSVVLAFTISTSAAAADLTALFEQGRAARISGQHEAAERTYRTILAEQPNNSDALYFLGLSLISQDRHVEAVDVFSRVLANAPGYVDALIARARAYSFAGRHDSADADVEALLKSKPNNAEVWASAGQISYYRGDLTTAEFRFRRAVALLPDHFEAMLGLADALAAQGRITEATERYQAAQLLRPAAPEPRERLARISSGILVPPHPRWELAVGGAYSRFSRQERDSWREYGAQLTRVIGPRDRIYVRGDYSDRGADEDQYAEIGGSAALNPDWTIRARAGAAGEADFLPKHRLASGFSYRALGASSNPTLLTGDVQHSAYQSGNILTLAPGVEQYLFSGRAWLTVQGMRIRDENQRWENGWLARADWQTTESVRIGIGMSDAPETNGSRTVDTRSLFSNLIWSAAEDLAFRIDYSREDRANSYIRHVLGLTVIRQF